MSNRNYRLSKDTVATVVQDGRRIVAEVPAGALLIVAENVEEGPNQRQVEVLWGERRAHMFAVDIRERCELLRDK